MNMSITDNYRNRTIIIYDETIIIYDQINIVRVNRQLCLAYVSTVPMW